jgi:hypothetical protein
MVGKLYGTAQSLVGECLKLKGHMIIKLLLPDVIDTVEYIRPNSDQFTLNSRIILGI